MIRRRPKYLVIHRITTPEGCEVSVADIRHWHTVPVSQGGRGWKQAGYTDPVHLDGMVGRPVDNNEDVQVGNWEVTNGAAGYNSVSRHTVYSGRYTGDGKTARDTRTDAQRTALGRHVKDFRRRFLDVRIVGHSEPAVRACPSFGVQAQLKSMSINR